MIKEIKLLDEVWESLLGRLKNGEEAFTIEELMNDVQKLIEKTENYYTK